MKKTLLKSIPLLIFILSLVILMLSPVNVLVIQDKDSILFYMPVSSTNTLTTGYVHSVQLTPVEDDYRIIDGSVWLWEERVVSHNAGLPVDAPRNGRFFQDKDWMYVQGGRLNSERIHMRVGDNQLGKNWLRMDYSSNIPLFEKYPSKLLVIKVETAPLVSSYLSRRTDLINYEK